MQLSVLPEVTWAEEPYAHAAGAALATTVGWTSMKASSHSGSSHPITVPLTRWDPGATGMLEDNGSFDWREMTQVRRENRTGFVLGLLSFIQCSLTMIFMFQSI